MDDAHELHGLVAGRYQIERRLGAGGMGEVYRARDRKLRRDVAIKRLPPAVAADEERRRQLLREARSAAQISHQGVAALHDVVEEHDEIYLVMELVEGKTLASLLKGPVDAVDAVRMIADISGALAAAHHRGVVHYDLKPANLMVTPERRVKILDFGLARLAAAEVDPDMSTVSQLTVTPIAAGTPPYMAPEVLLGKAADARADLFSLGVIAYQMLTGTNPFLGPTPTATVDRILHLEPPLAVTMNPAVPPQLEPILRKLLAKDPAFRYATTDDLLVDLRSLELELTQPTRTRPRLPSGSRRPRMAVALGAGAIAIALVLGWGGWNALFGGGPAAPERDPDARPENPTLVILPAVHAGSDAELRSLVDGLATSLGADLTRLMRSHEFQPLGPGSLSFDIIFPDLVDVAVGSVAEARRQLGADLVLTIGAQQQGDRLLLSVSLVDARSRLQLDGLNVPGRADAAIDLHAQLLNAATRLLQLDLQPLDRQALVVGTESDDAYGHFSAAEAYAAGGKLDLAIEQYEEALRADANYAAAYGRLGEALVDRYAGTGEDLWLDRAATECERSSALLPRDASALACRGRLLFARGDAAAAVPLLAEALRQAPTRYSLVQDLVDAHIVLEQPELAEAVLLDAIDSNPGFAPLRDSLGLFYVSQARYDDAAAAYEACIDLAPDNYTGFANLGAVYYYLGRWQDARVAFEASVQRNPGYYAGHSNGGTLAYFERDYAAAAASFEAALGLDDTDYRVWGNLGDALTMLQTRGGSAAAAWTRAAEMARQVLAEDDDDAETTALLAYYLASLGDREAAAPLLIRAAVLGAGDPNINSYLAQAWQRLGESQTALEHLRLALEAGFPRSVVLADPIFTPLHDTQAWVQLLSTPEGGKN